LRRSPIWQLTRASGVLTEFQYDVYTDHLDTPRLLVDQSGMIQWRSRRLAYGDTVVDEDPDPDPNNGTTTGDGSTVTFNIRFPGQHYDAKSGLHYNRYRYYDPTLGRYLNQDPIGQDGGANYDQFKSKPDKERSLFRLGFEGAFRDSSFYFWFMDKWNAEIDDAAKAKAESLRADYDAHGLKEGVFSAA